LDSSASAATNRQAGQRPSGASPGSERPHTVQFSVRIMGGPPIAALPLRKATASGGNRPWPILSRAQSGEQLADLVVDVVVAADRAGDLLADQLAEPPPDAEGRHLDRVHAHPEVGRHGGVRRAAAVPE